jgi:hypothetical protein
MTASNYLEPNTIADLTERFGTVQAAAIEAIRRAPEEFATIRVWLDSDGIPHFPTAEIETAFWIS